MEELQSTEILDREILEDARKKAQRILKAADDTIKAKSDEWEKKTAAALEELEKKYAEQNQLANHEIMAVLPLDKRRVKAKKIDELIRSAVEHWYTGLSRRQVLEFLQGELTERLTECEEFPNSETKNVIHVAIHRIDQAEAQTILQKVLPGGSFTIGDTHSSSPYPELVLETRDVRIHASIGKTVDFFINEKRAELLEALLGKAEIAEVEAL